MKIVLGFPIAIGSWLLVAGCWLLVVGCFAQPFELERSFVGHGNEVSYVAFRSEDNLIVSGDEAGQIIVWDMESGDMSQILQSHTGKITHLEFSNTGQQMASASYDGTIKIWDMKTYRLLGTYENSSTSPYDGMKGNEPSFVAFAPDDRSLYVGGYNLEVLSIDLKSKKQKSLFKNDEFSITCGRVSPDGKFLVFGVGAIVYFIDTNTGKIVKKLRKSEAFEDYICEIAFVPGQPTLAAWGYGGGVQFWDYRLDRLTNTLKATAQEGSSDLAFSGNARMMITGNSGPNTKLWNWSRKSTIQILGEHEAETVTFAFSGDGNYIVTGSRDKIVNLWSRKRKEVVDSNIPTQVEGRTVDIQEEFTVRGDSIEIQLWDDAKIDGDIISVNVNGQWILRKHGLVRERKIVTAPLRQRNNYLIIHAHNLGSVPPNTIAVVINDGARRRMVTLRSDEGKSAAIRLLRPKRK